ncbi:MAG: hypothetical protein ACKOUM_12600, partial [Sphingopyxis sp.]
WVTANGQIAGCYIHGLFNLASARAVWLNGASNGVDQDAAVDAALDGVADALARVVDVDALLAIAQLAAPCPTTC